MDDGDKLKNMQLWSTSIDEVGEDSASFSLSSQSLSSWVTFTVATTFVLLTSSYLWFLPPGPHLGDAFRDLTQSIVGTNPSATIFAMLTVFSVTHSGLASLRPFSEAIIGPRAHRVVFAVVSLPLALSCISYFVNHAHEGGVLWNVQDVPGVHSLVWVLNFLSFLLLYPSTFNLLEIAAVQEPKLHLWTTGVIRITRHPQTIGQVMWCAGHTLWMGTGVVATASAVLIAHHAFSVWNGDRRLREEFGDLFDDVEEQTSVIPFKAILEGRQVLPSDYWKEWARGPYVLVVGGTLAAYMAHPWMMAGAALLGW